MDFDIDYLLLYIHILCESINIYVSYYYNTYYNNNLYSYITGRTDSTQKLIFNLTM